MVGPSTGPIVAPTTPTIRDGKGWAPQAASTQVYERHRHLGPRLSLSQADPSRIPVNKLALPRLTPEGWLHLARPLRVGSALPDV